MPVTDKGVPIRIEERQAESSDCKVGLTTVKEEEKNRKTG